MGIRSKRLTRVSREGVFASQEVDPVLSIKKTSRRLSILLIFIKEQVLKTPDPGPEVTAQHVVVYA